MEAAAWFEQAKHPAVAALLGLRAVLLAVDPRVTESIKWNAPSYAVGEHFATFHVRGTASIQLILHLGTKPRRDAKIREWLADQAGERNPGDARIDAELGALVWKGADRAVLTVKDNADFEARKPAIQWLLGEWLRYL